MQLLADDDFEEIYSFGGGIDACAAEIDSSLSRY